MGEEEAKVEMEPVGEEKVVIKPPLLEDMLDETKDVAVVENVASAPSPEESPRGSADRDARLARVEAEKKISFVKAWEENEKCKVENKAQKKMSSILSWENSRRAAVEAKLRKIEESLEKKKAQHAEKMKNKVAMIHREAEEKRALAEAKRGEEILEAEEMAAKYRARGVTPKKFLGCFSP